MTLRLLKSLLLVWSGLVALGSCGLRGSTVAASKSTSFPISFSHFYSMPFFSLVAQGQVESSHSCAACSECACRKERTKHVASGGNTENNKKTE